MKLSVFIVGLLLIGASILGMYEFTNSMAASDQYNIALDDHYKDSFGQSNNISKAISHDYQKIMNFTTNKASTIGIITLVPDMLGLIKNTITLPLSLMEGIISTITGYFGLPDWFFTLIMVILSVGIIFAFAALIIGRDG